MPNIPSRPVLLLLLVSIFTLHSCKTGPNHTYSLQKQAFGKKAMVVSAHPLATEVGVQVLREGGNAIDAAIAVQYALAVTFPVAGNIGGGGFMVVRMADGEAVTLDFREKAPAAAHRDLYLDSLGNVIEGLSINGHLAAGVPGTVAGMAKAFDRYSQLKDMPRLLAPSIRLAEKGFAITAHQAKRLNDFRERFIKYNTSKPVFVKNGPWKTGDLLAQKDLARTLERIAKEGPAGFYEGQTADLIVAEMQAGGGMITHQDLTAYQAKWRRPIETTYKDYRLLCMPPPSSGGLALAQLLELVEPYPLAEWGFHSRRAIHLMAEAERRVYADRATHLGDSDYYPVPVDSLMNAGYLKMRMANFSMSKASNSDSILAGVFAPPTESEETTHFSIVDGQGNAVSLTTTINSGFGSKTVVSGAGFLLNNEMDDFSSKPGVPNFYGLIGAEANAIEPGKRMLSSMTPTIVTKDGQLFMVVGTPGGSTIITSVFQTILNVVEFKMGMADAVAARRFHHQWLPDALQYEKGTFPADLLDSLSAMGHQFKERGTIGSVNAILSLSDGQLEGGADPRYDDHAAGF